MVVTLYCPDTPYLTKPLSGPTTLERATGWVGSLDSVERVLVFAAGELPELPPAWKTARLADTSVATFVSALAEAVGGEAQTILIARLDAPFQSSTVTRRLIERHHRYAADVTLAEGYPIGLAPQVVHGRVLSRLRELASKMTGEVDDGLLFPVIQRDINAFDIETELARADRRLLRLRLVSDNAADTELCRRVASAGGTSTEDVLTWIDANPAQHRTLPRYVQIQVIEQEVQRVAYSPYGLLRSDPTAPGRTMGLDQFRELVGNVAELMPEATIAISLWGEISLHRQAVELIRSVSTFRRLSLIVETSGVGWSEQAISSLLDSPPERTTWIVGLDASDPAVYGAVRGDGFRAAQTFAERMLAAAPQSTFVQAVRTEATDPGLQAFYDEWSKRTPNVIIQKYDHFCRRLPRPSFGGTEPLRRNPCWHLQRDLVVLVDGTVAVCREDLEGSRLHGNAFSEPLSAIWERSAAWYDEHTSRRYAALCKECDEYYTFNA